MIRQLVTDLSRQIEEFGHLQRAASQVTSIQSVGDLLIPIQRDLSAWFSAFPLVEPYLNVGDAGSVRQQAAVLKRQFSQARDRFAADYGAPAGLNRMQSAAKAMLDDTRKYWQAYAEEQIRPLRSQINLAHRLPKMHRNIEEIDRTYKVLSDLGEKLPQRAEEVDLFSFLLAQLRARLGTIDGLSADQRAFLEKVQRGSATLDDVSGSLLVWCREEGLAGLLKVVF